MNLDHSASKRKRLVLTIKDKIEIIQRLDGGEKIQGIAEEYGIGKTTVSDIRRQRFQIMEFIKGQGLEKLSSRKTMKSFKNKELNETIYKWYMKEKNDGNNTSGQEICDFALRVNKMTNGDPSFKASSGWLTRFKYRYGLIEVDEDVAKKEGSASKIKKSNKTKIGETSTECLQNTALDTCLVPICMTCLSRFNCCNNIFTTKYLDKTLADILMDFASIQISDYNIQSPVICDVCMYQLKNFSKFRTTCIESLQTLEEKKTLVKKNTELLHTIIKEESCSSSEDNNLFYSFQQETYIKEEDPDYDDSNSSELFRNTSRKLEEKSNDESYIPTKKMREEKPESNNKVVISKKTELNNICNDKPFMKSETQDQFKFQHTSKTFSPTCLSLKNWDNDDTEYFNTDPENNKINRVDIKEEFVND